ncbi:MAG TPA: BtrH N-terminal domain-containing protein [Dehalococcoidia bacterium]|nr:BtrH N-terminal domain-containing protein [Dehalococcoidia bacterium]
MNKIIEGFVHRPGVHCDSSALRDIFEYHGFKFTEPMIFGLGSGLGFTYWRSKRMPFPFVGGRSRDLHRGLCLNLSITLRVNQTTSRARAYRTLKELISQDIPVNAHVDMVYLKYQNLPPEAHFGAHSVVVAGIDEDKKIAYLADTDFDTLQVVSLKELEEARASRFKPFPAQNRWFTFEFPRKLTPLPQAIITAISATASNMLNQSIKNLGVKGIRHFASEIINWPKEYPPQEFAWAYEMTYTMLEEDGTGGGGFRYLYSSFLKEAGETLGDKQPASLSGGYHRVGERWTQVARLIKLIPQNGAAQVDEIKTLLLEIADEEEYILNKLAGLVKI